VVATPIVKAASVVDTTTKMVYAGNLPQASVWPKQVKGANVALIISAFLEFAAPIIVLHIHSLEVGVAVAWVVEAVDIA